MIDLKNLSVYSVVEVATDEVVYESFYFSDVVEFINNDSNYKIVEHTETGYGKEAKIVFIG